MTIENKEKTKKEVDILEDPELNDVLDFLGMESFGGQIQTENTKLNSTQ